jgi:peptidoglycan/xylan/chitin deacetylase (PgdA/CDA1 family)
MYHRISSDEHSGVDKFAVDREEFVKQMEWLAFTEYQTITLEAWLACRRHEVRIPEKSVVITFDDGFQDCFEHAVPILCELRFTATFFLVASLVGKTSHWQMAKRRVAFALMDWTSVRALEIEGFRCESHTLTHPRLTDLSDGSCRGELSGSRQLLEDKIGREVRHLAYPFGSFDPRVQDIAADVGYLSACSVRQGLSSASDNIFELPRVPVTGEDTLETFKGKVQGVGSCVGERTVSDRAI